MKKGLLIALGVILMIVFMGGCSYNGMNGSQKEAQQKWDNVESAYQRRYDLIDNLVETVKGAANFEQTTLTQVIQARASASQIKLDPKDLSPEKLAAFQASQGQLSQALGRLMVVSEQYPQLKATEAFSKLQDEVAGTENRIAISRNEYNEAVRDYNVKVSSFPNVMLAGMFNFKELKGFHSEQGAEKRVKIKF
jgi:LemA protein